MVDVRFFNIPSPHRQRLHIASTDTMTDFIVNVYGEDVTITADDADDLLRKLADRGCHVPFERLYFIDETHCRVFPRKVSFQAKHGPDTKRLNLTTPVRVKDVLKAFHLSSGTVEHRNVVYSGLESVVPLAKKKDIVVVQDGRIVGGYPSSVIFTASTPPPTKTVEVVCSDGVSVKLSYFASWESLYAKSCSEFDTVIVPVFTSTEVTKAMKNLESRQLDYNDLCVFDFLGCDHVIGSWVGVPPYVAYQRALVYGSHFDIKVTKCRTEGNAVVRDNVVVGYRHKDHVEMVTDNAEHFFALTVFELPISIKQFDIKMLDAPFIQLLHEDYLVVKDSSTATFTSMIDEPDSDKIEHRTLEVMSPTFPKFGYSFVRDFEGRWFQTRGQERDECVASFM